MLCKPIHQFDASYFLRVLKSYVESIFAYLKKITDLINSGANEVDNRGTVIEEKLANTSDTGYNQRAHVSSFKRLAEGKDKVLSTRNKRSLYPKKYDH